MNFLKRTLAAMLIFLLLMPVGQTFAAATYAAELGMKDIGYEALVLNALDIVSLDDYNPEARITRGEFAEYIAKMMDMQDLLGKLSESSPFVDVPDDYTYKSAVMLAYTLGLMIGDENGSFSPNNNITYAQAVKILVSAVGYDIAALQKGGYPAGYLMVGASTGITRNTTPDYDSEIDMAAATRLIYNAMRVDIMSFSDYARSNYEVTLGSTLMNNKMQRNDIIMVRGIVTSNSITSFDDSAAFRKDEISIDGERYNNGGKNYDALLGYAVEAYIISDGSGPETVKSAFKLPNHNSELRIDSESIIDFRVGELAFDAEGYKARNTAEIASDAVYIYNGRLLSPVTDTDLFPISGFVTLISNNSDEEYDVVIIEDSRSLVVGSVSVTNGIIHFKEFAGQAITFKGKPAIHLNIDDDDYTTSITDISGNIVSLNDIFENDVVKITESKDGKLIRILVTRNSVTGVLQEISDDIIVVDETEYTLNKSNDYMPLTDVNAGDNALFYLDAYGKVIMSERLGNEGLTYAYVVDAKPDNNKLNQTVQLKLMHKASIEKVVDKNDITKITYTLRNGEMKILTAKDKVRTKSISDGSTIKKSADLNLKDTLVLYGTDSNGLIDRIEFPEVYNRPLGYTFNSKLVSFGGQLEGGFIIKDQSVVICVPLSGQEDDYYQQVKLVQGNTYDILGYDVDEVTTVAKGAVIKANMSASGSAAINNQSDVAIVKKLVVALNNDGETIYRVTILDDSTEKTLDFNDNSSVTSVAASLQTGYLINYTQDAFNRINGIKILARPTDYNSPTLIREWQTDEEVFGYVNSVKTNSFHSSNNEMVDRVMVEYDETGLIKEYIIPHENVPPIYLYKRATKIVENIKPEDFIPYSIAGSKASAIFMAVCEGVVRAVVIID